MLFRSGELENITGTLADTIGTINPLRYRGYYYDTETNLYYLQSRYYSPDLMRFISQDDPFYSNDQCQPLGSNLYAYCLGNPANLADYDGRRTYFINGINNNSSTGVPTYATTFINLLMKLGVKDARTIGIYKGKSGFIGTVKGVGKVILEMLNIDVYTNMIVKLIKNDLKSKPLAKGEQLNLIGYSGGGQVVLNVMVKMNGKINNAVLIGAPVMKIWKSKTKVSMIYSGLDPLSWNIGWGYKSYFAGWFGHTAYFNSKNINKVANIVVKIIK